MRRYLILTLLLFLPLNGYAFSDNYNFGNLELGLNIGYSSVDLKDVEHYWNELGNNTVNDFLTYLALTGSYGTASYTFDKVSGGLNVGADLVYMINNNIGLGAKIGYTKPNDMVVEVTGNGAFSETYSLNANFSSSLINTLLELVIQNENQYSGFIYGLSLAGGLGFGSVTVDGTERLVDPFYGIDQTLSAISSYSGSSFDFQIAGKLGKSISETVVLFALVGYNYCNITEMTSNDNVDINNDGVYDIKKGDKYKDSLGKVLNFDFSGIIVNGGIRFVF